MMTIWVIKFRGTVSERHTVSSANHKAAQITMEHTLAKIKRNDPSYANDYTMAEVRISQSAQ